MSLDDIVSAFSNYPLKVLWEGFQRSFNLENVLTISVKENSFIMIFKIDKIKGLVRTSSGDYKKCADFLILYFDPDMCQHRYFIIELKKGKTDQKAAEDQLNSAKEILLQKNIIKEENKIKFFIWKKKGIPAKNKGARSSINIHIIKTNQINLDKYI